MRSAKGARNRHSSERLEKGLTTSHRVRGFGDWIRALGEFGGDGTLQMCGWPSRWAFTHQGQAVQHPRTATGRSAWRPVV
eukprot:364202-Chlamydomonas_euryale.AAC.7